MNTLGWALAYASLGWRVFPVVPGGKRPVYAGWQRDATTDPDLIARYWRREPGPNVGLICGEAFVAYDIEAAHLPALWAWMAEAAHKLPETPVARTGRGGIHILACAHEQPLGRVLRLGGVHMGELKAQGGFIVACPAVTAGQYVWLRSPLTTPVTDAPDWLIGLATVPNPSFSVARAGLVGPTRGEARLAALTRTVVRSTEGRRNSLLYWARRRALDDGIPAVVASSVLARMAGVAGLDQREIATTIRSAERASQP